jgi:hypothetical protein
MEIALTEAELKNRDHSGGIYMEYEKKRAKIWERRSVLGDQWEKMSLRDVSKENMTGFWNILRVKIRPILYKKYNILSPQVFKKQP